MAFAHGSGGGFQLESGDRVCWIGDSITRNGNFHAIINRALLASGRVPNLQFFNCGLSGDTADGALRRLDYDVFPHRPTVAFVMLGMNDVRRELYSEGRQHAAIDAERTSALTNYRQRLDEIVVRLREFGTRVVLVTPSPYDQIADLASENLPGVDDALRECSRHVRELAMSRGLQCIEMHQRISAINIALHAIDPQFTIIGSDRVHPGMAGHALMADGILNAIGYESPSGSIRIGSGDGSERHSSRCTIDRYASSTSRIAFELSIPWVPYRPPPVNILGNPWNFKAMRMSSLLLLVRGLGACSYAISVDGSRAVNTTGQSLENGLDILENDNSPLWDTWSEMSRILDEAHRLDSDVLRHLIGVDHFILRPEGIDPSDEILARDRVAHQLTLNRTAAYAYGIWQCEFWLKMSSERQYIERRMSRLMKKARFLAESRTHHIAIEPEKTA